MGERRGSDVSKPLVTIAVSEVTCGKAPHMAVVPQVLTEKDG